MNDIKLIVSDMDGTLLNSDHEMSTEFSDIAKQLNQHHILFVPASGRQMQGITQYFEGEENQMAFIAENGGYLKYKDEDLFIDALDNHLIPNIIRAIREIPDAKAVVSGKNSAYYETEDDEFVAFFTKYYTANEKREDLTEIINDSIFKIAVYHPINAEQYLLPTLKKFNNDDLEVVVSGEFWLDIMNKNINKGNTLLKLQDILGISAEQTMAFGDYLNDIEMLKLAKYSYAMENAHPDVKKIAQHQALSNDQFGVLKVIKAYLNTL